MISFWSFFFLKLFKLWEIFQLLNLNGLRYVFIFLSFLGVLMIGISKSSIINTNRKAVVIGV